MFALAGFKVGFAPFSVILAFVYTASGLLMVYFSLKAFSVANLSVYSVFSMLGGMLLPFLLGVFFFNEGFSVGKAVCLVLIFAAVLLGIEKKGGSRRAALYYFGVFVLNGLAGVISKIHQSSAYAHVDSEGFMFLTAIWGVVIAGIWLLIGYKKIPMLTKTELLLVTGYGAFNGMGNLFLLIALGFLPASVQYPLVTGGVMVISTVISALRREHLTKKELIAAALAFLASVAIII